MNIAELYQMVVVLRKENDPRTPVKVIHKVTGESYDLEQFEFKIRGIDHVVANTKVSLEGAIMNLEEGEAYIRLVVT